MHDSENFEKSFFLKLLVIVISSEKPKKEA